jgi:hypothetical protein
MRCCFVDMTTTMATHGVDVWRERIRAEYLEMPALHLTSHQVQRLWGLDEPTCRMVLAVLEAEKFLRRTRTGTYALA